jgi:hypothetical protein
MTLPDDLQTRASDGETVFMLERRAVGAEIEKLYSATVGNAYGFEPVLPPCAEPLLTETVCS